MNLRPKHVAPLALLIAATLAAPAFATETNEVHTLSSAIPHYYVSSSVDYYAPAEIDYYYGTAPTEEYYVPATTDYYVPATTQSYYVPAPTENYYYAPPVTVYGSRGDEDRYVTEDVAAELASDPYLSGNIGVETHRDVVTLTGRVGTLGQVDRATLDTERAADTREVRNDLRPRVGG